MQVRIWSAVLPRESKPLLWFGGGGAKGRKTGTFNKPLELTQDVLGAGNLSFFCLPIFTYHAGGSKGF